MTRGELRSSITITLNDLGVVYNTADEYNDAIQDAYDDVTIYCKQIIKNTTLNWIPNLAYYDFKTAGVSDYMGAIAIFNNVNNQWLDDSVSLRQFDSLHPDWEKRLGTVLYWTPVSFKFIAVYPQGNTGSFVLHYWAEAPVLTADSDEFLIATDMQQLLEKYAVADLLETSNEFTKAMIYWKEYYTQLEIYKERCRGLARVDLLQGV